MDKRIGMVIILLMTVTLTACRSNTPINSTTEISPSEEMTSEVTFATTSETTAEDTSEASDNSGILASDLFDRETKLDRYAYEYVMSSDGKVIGGFMIWVDGDRVRYDVVDQGQSMYFDYEKQEAYLYVEAENTLIKTPINTLGTEWESPFMFAAELDDSALLAMKNIGTETVDGKKCQIFEYDNADTKVTYYVWEEKGFILKMIMEIEGQPSYEYYFKNLDIDGNFDDELELPEGATIVG